MPKVYTGTLSNAIYRLALNKVLECLFSNDF